MTGVVHKLKRVTRRLIADRRGAIAPMMAVSLVPMLIGAGVAIDVARLSSSRSTLQDAVDSANLALARLPPSTSTADLKTKAEAWIKANIANDSSLQNLVVSTPTRSLGVIKLDATAQISTTFSAFLGVSTVPLGGHSTVKYGTSHIELALVLDNTGSMADNGKLDSLKSAATTLVNTLADSADASGDPNALKIGVVPFSMTVNVGSQYSTASWMSGAMPATYGLTADVLGTTHPNRFTLLKNMGNVAWGGCIESRPMPYDVQDTAPTAVIPATLFVPFFAPDEPDAGYYKLGSTTYRHYSNTSGQITWNNNYLTDGYTGDSANINNSSNGSTQFQTRQEWPTKYTTLPKTGPNTTNPVWGDAVGPNSGCQIKPLLRLTTDMSSVRNKLNDMIATGDTEIPLGLVWGWHLLSPNAPFADGTAYATSGTIKIVVLVTDGQNTYGSSNNLNLSNYTAYGYAASKRIASAGTAAATASALNDRLAQLCANMKTKNPDGTDKIVIYTVPVMVTDATVKGLLQNCATSPDNYIDVSSAAGIEDAFANIAGSISALRVAH